MLIFFFASVKEDLFLSEAEWKGSEKIICFTMCVKVWHYLSNKPSGINTELFGNNMGLLNIWF